MFLVLYVLNEAELTEQIIDSWEEAGVSGITILPSSGLGRTRRGIKLRDDIPLIPSLKDFLEPEETFSWTIFSVVSDESLVDRLIDTTTKIVGDLSRPGTGLLAVIPVVRALGLEKKSN
jgi:nitrogen regulatory protein P-II 1